MIKEIETPFFDNVKEIWDKGIKVLEFEYKKAVLGYDTSKTPKLLVPKWEVSNQKAFATNLYWLFDEIKANLDECKGLALERYIFSLMMPFKGLADVLHNDNLARMGEESINKWKPFNEWVFDEIQRAKTPEPQPEPEQAAPEPQNSKEGIYRGCVYTMSNLFGVAFMYANMLDAVLLERGIDLKAIQNQVGVTLLTKRDLTQIGYYLGTPERAKDLISRVAPEPEPPQPLPEGNDKVMLPEVLNTDEAKRLLDRLCKAGFAKIENWGYRWIGTKYLCAYFADRASHSLNLSNTMDKEGNIATSWKPFEALFGIDGLKGAKQNWMRLNTKFEPTGFEAIAKLFEPEG
jgi:hypothetical protein